MRSERDRGEWPLAELNEWRRNVIRRAVIAGLPNGVGLCDWFESKAVFDRAEKFAEDEKADHFSYIDRMLWIVGISDEGRRFDIAVEVCDVADRAVDEGFASFDEAAAMLVALCVKIEPAPGGVNK